MTRRIDRGSTTRGGVVLLYSFIRSLIYLFIHSCVRACRRSESHGSSVKQQYQNGWPHTRAKLPKIAIPSEPNASNNTKKSKL
jgi:hypothetical protein